MPADNKVGVFSTSMRTEFLSSFQAAAEPAPWEGVTQIIPSTARIEHYTWMAPSPGMSRWTGHRNYGKTAPIRYSVENLEFANGIEIPKRDIEDDMTSGYMMKAKELAEKAKLFPGRWVTKHLAAGATRLCFDGTAFFADSHTLGSGDNLLTATGSANSDGLAYKVCALYTGGILKPLLWQARKPPEMRTNSGNDESSESKMVRYWCDMEGEAAYGWWWNGVQLTFTNLPTVVEMHSGFAAIEAAFRTFKLPKSLDTDDEEYVHEQNVFTSSNLTMVGSTALAEIFRQALNQDWTPQTIGSTSVAVTNRFQGFANWFVSGFLNP